MRRIQRKGDPAGTGEARGCRSRRTMRPGRRLPGGNHARGRCDDRAGAGCRECGGDHMRMHRLTLSAIIATCSKAATGVPAVRLPPDARSGEPERAKAKGGAALRTTSPG